MSTAKLRVTVLGCGGSAGVPQIGGPDGRGDWGACDPAEPRNRRSRSSIILEPAPGGQGGRLLVDTGPDLRAQLLACAVPRVDAILFTHAHADHLVGLDEVRILNRILGAPMPVALFAQTLEEIARRFDYVMQPRDDRWDRPGRPPVFARPVLDIRTVSPEAPFDLAGHHIVAFEQDHGFSRTLGFRCGDFAYCTDVATLDPTAMAILAGVDTWLVGCFQRASHRTHANVDQVIAWVEQIRPRRTILTHMGFDLDHGWLRAHLPAGIEPAHDGMAIEVG
jgi:phosphoribosyl 1,2-cyclic phosphate phosphodiesterase